MKQRHIDTQQLDQLETRYRTHLINSLGGFKSVVLIGTANTAGQSNLSVFNSVVHLGANPALIGFIVRPDSVERHTWNNIETTGSYTINHIHEGIYKQAHQSSAKYSSSVSEFSEVGLTEEYKTDIHAPFVKESLVQIGLTFEQRIPIELNGTSLIIGRIRDLFFPEVSLSEDGFVDLEKAGSLAGSGLDGYFKTQRLSRLSYAKVGSFVSEL
jgi:flavin reductase (DIM6/NTAB) family NADH-FMN oxidoreductase RutF